MLLSQIKINAANRKYAVCLDYEGKIGFRSTKETKEQWMWHWFDITNYNGVEEVDFNHTYSQMTGKSHKSTTHRIKIKERFGFYDEKPEMQNQEIIIVNPRLISIINKI